MRTTVDLPPAVHRRASELARQRGQSLSAVLADLTMRGLASVGAPVSVKVDIATGFPSISIGRPLSDSDVADLLDDE
jgi:hypothetical protein